MRIVIDKEMLALTHIVASLLLIQLMTLDRNDAFVALLFGVFIDLDHLFGLKNYAESVGQFLLARSSPARSLRIRFAIDPLLAIRRGRGREEIQGVCEGRTEVP